MALPLPRALLPGRVFLLNAPRVPLVTAATAVTSYRFKNPPENRDFTA